MKTYNITDEQRQYLTVKDNAIAQAILKGACSPYANVLVKLYEGMADCNEGKMVFFVPHTIIEKQVLDITKEINFGNSVESKPLYEEQKVIMGMVEETMQKNNGCIIGADTGQGKTIMMIHLIKQKKQKTMIIVPDLELMKQTKIRLLEQGIKEDNIGFYGSGKKQWGKNILIITSKSLIRINEKTLESSDYPIVFLDECHKCVGNETIHSLLHLNYVEMYGLSATPYTNRFNDYAMQVFFGEIIKYGTRKIIPEVYVYKYDNPYLFTPSLYIKDRSEIFDKDMERLHIQAKIAEDLLLKYGRKHILMLYDRTLHSNYIHNYLLNHGSNELKQAIGNNIFVLNGTLNNNIRKEQLDGFKKRGGILVAYHGIAGTGLDVPKIDTVCIFFPNKFDGGIIQMVGRALRECEGKEGAWVVDFFDTYLKHQFYKRRQVYKEKYGKEAKLLKDAIDYTKLSMNDIF